MFVFNWFEQKIQLLENILVAKSPFAKDFQCSTPEQNDDFPGIKSVSFLWSPFQMCV